MAFEDKTLVCTDCGVEFIFSTREQEFYEQKGFISPPKRCRSCRNIRRSRSSPDQTREHGNHPSRHSADVERIYRGPSSRPQAGVDEEYRSPAFRNSDPSQLRHDRKDRVLYEIVCEQCGIHTKVPFKPLPDRPVYCRDCYQQIKESKNQ